MQQEAASEKQATVQATSMVIVGPPSGGLTAVQAEDGLVVWDYPTPPASFWLACSDEAIYFSASISFRKGYPPAEVSALRARDGTLLWRTALQAAQGPVALAVDDDTVFAVGSGINRAVFALGAQTGSVRWITPDMRGCAFRLIAGWNTFINWAALTNYLGLTQTIGTYRLLGAHSGIAYLDANKNTGVHALDAHTGKERWRSGKYSPVSLTTSDSHVYTIFNGWRLVAALRTSDGASENTLTIQQERERLLTLSNQGIAYLARGSQVCAVRVSDGELIWSTGHIWNKAISFKDVALQVCLSDQTLAYRIVQLVPPRLTVGALDRQTGQKLWEWSSDEQLANVSNACRIASGHRQVYLPTRQGLFAFREHDGHISWHIWPNTDLALAQLVIVPQA